jgi:Domain of unknown function (DUF4384)
MSFSKFLIPLSAAVASVAVAQTAQPAPKSQLTPRELFYSAGPAPVDVHSQKAPPKDQGPKGSKGRTPKGNPDGTAPGGVELPGGGQIIKASAGPPIGVTYTLQRKVGDDMVDVSPDAVFHKDDRIAFVVQTNYPGYLYIGNKGPAGAWTPLFPSSKIENGDNRVAAFHKYAMPPGYRFYFDEKTGVEDVFILFSREPVPDFEKLLYADQGASKTAPKSSDDKSRPKAINVATADLPASMVDRLRSAYSRDLLIEKIDDDKPGERKEKAVYIVNPTGNSDSHVWADIRLVHK